VFVSKPLPSSPGAKRFFALAKACNRQNTRLRLISTYFGRPLDDDLPLGCVTNSRGFVSVYPHPHSHRFFSRPGRMNSAGA